MKSSDVLKNPSLMNHTGVMDSEYVPEGMDLILEYISNRTKEGDQITNLGDGEIQCSRLNCIPSNHVFTGDHLKNVIQDIIIMYFEDEEKDWEACGKPDNHIYMDLLVLKSLL